MTSLENGKRVNFYESMFKLSDIYKSNVLGFFVGPKSQPFICVNGSEAVCEALHNNDLIGRARIHHSFVEEVLVLEQMVKSMWWKSIRRCHF